MAYLTTRARMSSSFSLEVVMNQTAVQIVKKVDGTYVLDKAALHGILQQNNILTQKVAVLTVAGAFRKGKSFFLSNCVRYLQCQKDGSDWMEPTAVISGFEWKQSRDSVTEGILMWPEAFMTEDENGEVAILLMDTEGAFDHKSSMTQCATIFALSALISSVLVCNVMQDIQEDTLNNLQFFASYGTYALEKTDNNSPFQSLLFLIRDWQNDDEYGMEAGERLLEEKFKLHSSCAPFMQQLRKDIKRSFSDMHCFLLPSPGSKIIKGSEGTVTVDDMDEDFREGLCDLIPQIFDTLITPKNIGRMEITGVDFLSFFEAYAKLFASGDVPEPKTIHDATVEATHQSALKASMEFYTTEMNRSFSQISDRQFFEESKLQSMHSEAMNAAIKTFHDAKKMGNLPQYLEMLVEQITNKFEERFLKDNQNRITVERVRKDKEEAERKKIETERKAREERARYEAEQERLRLQAAKEKREKEEAERKRAEEARRYEEKLERERREKEERERRWAEEQKRERERMGREMKEQRERERRESEERERRWAE
ncbi:hypothetical protein PMAYCL1PPCAC_10375, partial [Pristionchus mayeri]